MTEKLDMVALAKFAVEVSEAFFDNWGTDIPGDELMEMMVKHNIIIKSPEPYDHEKHPQIDEYIENGDEFYMATPMIEAAMRAFK